MRLGRFAVGLHEIYSSEANHASCVDIIAIHGLDTGSPDTWLCRSDVAGQPSVNWLNDPQMLPTKVGQARIFTCDWPAEMFLEGDRHEGGLKEVSRLLLDGILSRPLPQGGDGSRRERPIIFIASCLGGIILMQALTLDSVKYAPIKKATRGIVFLATPFRGTSFQDIAAWAQPRLENLAALKGRKVTLLLDFVKKQNFDLIELVRSFTSLALHEEYEIQTFYEARTTSLAAKIPVVGFFLGYMSSLLPQSLQSKQLVDQSSATLDIDQDPLRLDRTHVMMNKFPGPDDVDYRRVSENIGRILENVRDALSSLALLDDMIRKHYTDKMLRIERLSGKALPMDQCYINLALVQRQKKNNNDDRSKKASLSLFAQLRTETPEEEMQVELESIFDARTGLQGRSLNPRRILIRGRAGVGKSTLCKKIVYNFTQQAAWKHLFDRVIWIPLRNLKSKRIKDFNLQGLLYSEFFSQSPDGVDQAEAIWRELEANKYGRTLFVLDGLDEISEAFDQSEQVHELLETLLNLPNVIITTRPHIEVPYRLDLELETIGFYPEQVEEYVAKSISDKDKAARMHEFIRGHKILQGLVRIPIQLDAVCYIWERHDVLHVPRTMTAIYRSLELSLWKKDIKRIDRMAQEAQRQMLEAMAFSGLLGNTINFDYMFRGKVSQLKTARGGSVYPDWDDDLAKLSFMRTSDSSVDLEDQTFHFLHLTFQEYFAACYFVRHWEANTAIPYVNVERWQSDRIEPVRLVQTQKYTARFNIFWRFVCGLLEDEGQAASLIDRIEDEPRDIVGIAHRTLVMHCLSEISETSPVREDLEPVLAQVVVGDTQYFDFWDLFSQESTEGVRIAILRAVLEDEDSFIDLGDLVRGLADPYHILPLLSPERLGLLGHQNEKTLSEDLKSMHQRPLILERMVRGAAADDILAATVETILKRTRDLSEECQEKLVELLQSGDDRVADLASSVLNEQAGLPPRIIRMLLDLDLEAEEEEETTKKRYRDALASRSPLAETLSVMKTLGVLDESQVSAFSHLAPQDYYCLPESLSGAVMEELGSEDPAAYLGIEELFRWGRRKIPDDLVDALRESLDNGSSRARLLALNVLCSQREWQDWLAGKIVARLQTEEWYSKLDVMDLVRMSGNSDAVPGELVDAIFATLRQMHDDGDPATDSGLQVLQWFRHRLSDEQFYNAAFWSFDSGRRDLASSQDGEESTLRTPDEVLRDLLTNAQGGSSDPEQSEVALRTLAFLARDDFPRWALEMLLAGFGEHPMDHRGHIIELLGLQHRIPDDILQSVFGLLYGGERWLFGSQIGEALCRGGVPATPVFVEPYSRWLVQTGEANQVSIYFDGGCVCINRPQGVARLEISGSWSSFKDGVVSERVFNVEDTGPDLFSDLIY